MKKKSGDELGWLITDILIFIKADSKRGTFIQQSIDDLSEMEWSKIVDLGVIEVRKVRKNELIVKIEIQAETDKELIAAKRLTDKETIKRVKRTRDV
jgi:hypothetical protein